MINFEFQSVLRDVGITRGEQRIIESLMEGKTTEETAAQYSIGVTAVKYHFTRIFKKMKVKNRVQLVLKLAQMALKMSQADT